MAELGQLLAGFPLVAPGVPVPDQGGGLPVPPAADPIQQNAGLWGNLIQKLQDPNVRTSLMATGAAMMRSAKPGENGLDVVGTAVQSGMNTLQNLRSMQKAEGVHQKQEERADKTLAIQEGNATLSARSAESNIASNKAELKLKEDQLAEAIRSNKSNEEIARLRAEADSIRVKADSTRATTAAGGGGGKDPASIRQINMLSSQYQQQGMTPTDADARATREVVMSSKSQGPGALAQDLYLDSMKMWQQDINNIGKSMSPAVASQLLEQAKATALSLAGMNQTGMTPPPSPTTGIPPMLVKPEPSAAPLPANQGVINRPGAEIPSFATEAEAIAAWKAGKITGSQVIIAGKPFKLR